MLLPFRGLEREAAGGGDAAAHKKGRRSAADVSLAFSQLPVAFGTFHGLMFVCPA